MGETADKAAGGGHTAGGTYAAKDFSPAAQRSAARVTPDADLPSLDDTAEAEPVVVSAERRDLPAGEVDPPAQAPENKRGA